jgi:radical SAM protein (TIGR01212 family)
MKKAEPHSKLFSWGTARRFNSYTDYLISRFGERVQKVSVDAGFTCPNRDGSKGFGGCTYCNNISFVPPYCHPGMSIREQVGKGVEYLTRRYKAKKFVVYFQAYSNTYAPISYLKNIYENALLHPAVIGLSIGTRPDCIDKEKIEYLAELAKQYYITIEYGLESIHNSSLNRLNRGHNFEDWVAAIELTSNRGIHIASHVILGLPHENKTQMLQTAEIISQYPIEYLKIHHLHLINKTILANQYLKEPFPLLKYRDYLDLVIEFLELLRPSIKLQRLVGETHPRHLIGPKWGLRVPTILKQIEEKLEQKNTWQGKKYRNLSRLQKMNSIKPSLSVFHPK